MEFNITKAERFLAQISLAVKEYGPDAPITIGEVKKVMEDLILDYNVTVHTDHLRWLVDEEIRQQQSVMPDERFQHWLEENYPVIKPINAGNKNISGSITES